MSVKVMGLVWDLSNSEIQRDEKYILLAYADHADHRGGSIFPKVSTIAEKTGYSERSVQRITRKLEGSGYLMPEGGQKGGVGITPHWRIPIKDDKIAPFDKGDKIDSERVTKSTAKGDIAVSPDPSLTINLNRQEEEGDRPNIFALYENNIGTITTVMRDVLIDAEETYPEAWINEAIGIAVKNNARRWNYVEAILKRWETQGKDNGYQPRGGPEEDALTKYEREQGIKS